MAQTTDLLKAMQEMLLEMKDDIRTNREEMKINQAKMNAN
jgi:hypothetical protein